MSLDKQLVVSRYKAGLTLRECAELFGVSMQRIHQIVRKTEPTAMRAPYVIPPRRRGHGRKQEAQP